MEKNNIIVKLDQLDKSIKAKKILSGINLTVRKGESIGLVGPNGAGKTTLLSLIQGIKKPTSGSVEIFGDNPNKPVQRLKLGVSPQSISLPDTFKAGELVEFVRNHYPNKVDFKSLIEEFHLESIVNSKVGGLSGGQKRLLSTCLAFAGNPELVLLDEPTTGLDVKTRDLLWKVIISRNVRGGTTIIVTSHYLEDIETLTQRIVKIDKGQIHIDEELSRLKSTSRRMNVSIKVENIDPFTQLPSVESYTVKDNTIILKTLNSEELIKEIVMLNEKFEDLLIFEDRLDHYFMSNTEEIRQVSP
ncbi:ABC transporter ATP-binding protein [Bacillus weihaiensis]|uniref:ABC transporter ATP-binding protein n=1 Tax=Bacillus weihaiensis TaxID=1547283 RepID=UPI002357B3CF|nr:ABC transporter ATP-binding protein [Bacillus weihaiensis]